MGRERERAPFAGFLLSLSWDGGDRQKEKKQKQKSKTIEKLLDPSSFPFAQ